MENMIRPLRFLDEYLLGSETRRWYMNQISLAREFILDRERLQDYIRETTKELYFFLGAGRTIPDTMLAYGSYKAFSGDASLFDFSIAASGELLRFLLTATQRLDRKHVREYNLNRTLEEEVTKSEPHIVYDEEDL